MLNKTVFALCNICDNRKDAMYIIIKLLKPVWVLNLRNTYESISKQVD